MEKTIEELKKEIQQLRMADNKEKMLGNVSKKYENMSVEEYLEISALYGQNISEIKACSEYGKKPLNFVQNTVKMMYPVQPVQMKADYEELSSQLLAFRKAYYTTKQNHTFCVTLNKRKQNISFFDISDKARNEKEDFIRNAIASDRKRSFQLEREPLVRVSVFKTEENLSFVVITQMTEGDGFETANRIVNKLFQGAVLYKPNQRITETLDKVKRTDNEKFWHDYLLGIQEQTHVPGYVDSGKLFQKKNLSTISKEALIPRLEAYAAEQQADVTDILEAAWTVLLYYYKLQPDVVFGIADGENSGETFPLRSNVIENESIDVLIHKIHKNKERIHAHRDISLEDIEKTMGLETPLLTHMLSFQNMSSSGDVKAVPNKSRAVMLGNVTYEEEMWNFCLHIRFLRDRIALNAIYNGCNYTQETVEILLSVFLKSLEAIMDKDKVKVEELQFTSSSELRKLEEKKEKEKLEMVLELSRLSAFSSLPVDELEKIVTVSTIENVFAGDSIITAGAKLNTVDIICEGYVQLTASSRKGWERPLLLLKSGEIISNEWMISGGMTDYSAVAMFDDTRVLRIPTAVMEELLNKYSGVGQQIYRIEHERFAKMASLWIDIE